MENNPAVPAMLPPDELRMHVDTMLEDKKLPILDYYELHSLDQLVQYLRTSHGVSVQRRQLVYKLGIWGASKYSTRDEEQLHSLLRQYVKDSIKTGSLFMHPIDRGYALFKWGFEADPFVVDIRTDDGHDTLSPSCFMELLGQIDSYLSSDFCEVIRDEHPQLMSVLFGVWEAIAETDHTNAASRYFIHRVYALCHDLLGENHLITKTFECLILGSFKPAECQELLWRLPATLFTQRSESLGPSFETSDKTNDKTNDYQIISSESSKTWTPKSQTLKQNLGKVEMTDHLSRPSLHTLSEGVLSRRFDPNVTESDNLHVLAIRHLREKNDEQCSKAALPTFPWNTSTDKWLSLAEPSHEQPFISLHLPSVIVRSQTQSSIEQFNERDTKGSWPPKEPERVSSSVSENVGQSSANVFQHHHSKDTPEDRRSDDLELFGYQTSDCQSLDHDSFDYQGPTQRTRTRHETERQVVEGETSVSPYGDSDITSDSTAGEQQKWRALEAEKRQIVQKAMDAFLQDLDSHLEDITGNIITIKEEDASEPTQVPSQAEGSTRREWSQKPRKRQKPGDGKKGIGGRRDQGQSGDKDECNESDDEEDGGKKRPRKVSRSQDGTGGVLFACPFFKWNPLAYARKKECSGPGWESVHRVK